MSRRGLLRAAGGAAATGLVGSIAGCTGGGGGGQSADREVYVVAFHWGFRQITPDGEVVDTLDLSTGQTLAIHGVNLEPIAEGEELDIPDAVYQAAKENYKDWEHASVQRIAEATGSSVDSWESKLAEAEEQYKTHGLGVTGPGGDTVADVTLPGDMTAPVTKTVTVDSTGEYGYVCTEYCGPGHTHMQLNGALTVQG